MNPERRRFDRAGMLAIAPEALQLSFAVNAAPPASREVAPGVVCVSVCGPLTYDGMLFDSYAAIRCRVQAALEACAPTVVVLRLDSPGGEVAGAFDTARAIRDDVHAAGASLVAWTETKALSAAFALACVADQIVASRTAELGSIGVIGALVDETAAIAAKGLRVAVVASGMRKADGNPMVALTDDAIAAAQARVDSLAAEFFALVAENRGVSADAIAALQAETFVARDAPLVLVDRIETFDALVARLSIEPVAKIDRARIDQRKPTAASSAYNSESTMPDPDKDEKDEKPVDKARHALVQALESPDKATVDRARRALAAYDEDDKAEGDDEDKPAAAAPAAAPAAESDESDEDKPGAVAARAVAASYGARIKALEATNRALEADARSALLATPGITPELAKVLERMPLGEAKAIVAALPKAPAGSNSLVPQLASPPAQGARPAVPNALAAQMGLVQYDTNGVVSDGVIQTFGVAVPKVQK